jgi:uncharacterized membrane protein YkoI
MKTSTFSRKLLQKKVLIPAILGAGILLLASAFIVASPLENSWAQQQLGMNNTNPTDILQHNAMPNINGSVNVKDGIKNFFAENVKTPFVTAAQTAQEQVTNGTVLGGHIGVTQGYLTYNYFVLDPANDKAYKVIIDAGNGQVLYTSEGEQMGFGGNNGGFGPFGHGFGPFGHGFGPFGHGQFGFAPWSTSGGFMGGGGVWH